MTPASKRRLLAVPFYSHNLRSGSGEASCSLPTRSPTLNRLGVRREAQRHAAFARAAVSDRSFVSRTDESGVAAALCHRSP
jgi:hypothetical protein